MRGAQSVHFGTFLCSANGVSQLVNRRSVAGVSRMVELNVSQRRPRFSVNRSIVHVSWM